MESKGNGRLSYNPFSQLSRTSSPSEDNEERMQQAEPSREQSDSPPISPAPPVTHHLSPPQSPDPSPDDPAQNPDDHARLNSIICRITEGARRLNTDLQQALQEQANGSSPSALRSDSPDMHEIFLRLFNEDAASENEDDVEDEAAEDEPNEDGPENSPESPASSPIADIRHLFAEANTDSNRSSPDVLEGYEDFFQATSADNRNYNNAPPLQEDSDSAISEDCDDEISAESPIDINRRSNGIYRTSSRSHTPSRATSPGNAGDSSHSPESNRHPFWNRGSVRFTPTPPSHDFDEENKTTGRSCCCGNNLHFHSPDSLLHNETPNFGETLDDADEFERAFHPPNEINGFLDYEVIEVLVPACNCVNESPTVHLWPPRLVEGLIDDSSSDEEFESPILPSRHRLFNRISIPLNIEAPRQPAPRFNVFMPDIDLLEGEEEEILLEGELQLDQPLLNQTDSDSVAGSSQQQPDHSQSGREQNHGETSRDRAHNFFHRTGREGNQTPRQQRRERPNNQLPIRAREQSPSIYDLMSPIRDRSPPIRDRSPIPLRDHSTPTEDFPSEENENEIVSHLQQVSLQSYVQDGDMAVGTSLQQLGASASGVSRRNVPPIEETQNEGLNEPSTSRKRTMHNKNDAESNARLQKTPKLAVSPRKRSEDGSETASSEQRSRGVFGHETPSLLDAEVEMIEARVRSAMRVADGSSGRVRPASPLPLRSADEAPSPVRPRPLRSAEPCCLHPQIPNEDLPTLSSDDED